VTFVSTPQAQAILLQNPQYPSSNIRALGYLERRGVETTRQGATTYIKGTTVGVIGQQASTSLNPAYQPGQVSKTFYGRGR